MVSVKALTNIEHDGEIYTKGQSIELKTDQADALIEAGVATKGRHAQEAEVIEEKPKTKAELLAEAESEGLVLEGINGDSKRDQIVEAIAAARAVKQD
ncbi:hypothetical protein [Curtobacterium sp. MCSS17_007]|uniref:DUF7210 family protein n=1 Tax=Curtobacterium sp. MCSS17_007 TaxID=2175646 RepID=UPI000DA8FF36|nr:hypothetical protein [Curtobacterium sp. MCSS17_007]WIE74489.1 hypothetical protein DEJ22_009360 [Curtobacterium sp. MCSS17_007]